MQIDEQLLLVTKLEYRGKYDIIANNYCSEPPLENTRKSWKRCSKLTIKTLGQHHLISFMYLHV